MGPPSGLSKFPAWAPSWSFRGFRSGGPIRSVTRASSRIRNPCPRWLDFLGACDVAALVLATLMAPSLGGFSYAESPSFFSLSSRCFLEGGGGEDGNSFLLGSPFLHFLPFLPVFPLEGGGEGRMGTPSFWVPLSDSYLVSFLFFFISLSWGVPATLATPL